MKNSLAALGLTDLGSTRTQVSARASGRTLPEKETSYEQDDDKCDRCGKVIGFSNLKRHRCKRRKKVFYFCDACLEVHCIENGELAGRVVDFY